MKHRVLFEAIKDGVSILTCRKPERYIYIENNEHDAWCNVLEKYSQSLDGTEYLVVKYEKKRYKKTEPDEFFDPVERMEYRVRDHAKHLSRLAIAKKTKSGYRIMQDDLLYVSKFNGGMAIGCNAKGDVLLLNERGQTICTVGKRCKLMKFVDWKTGKTYRQLLKEYAKVKENP